MLAADRLHMDVTRLEAHPDRDWWFNRAIVAIGAENEAERQRNQQ